MMPALAAVHEKCLDWEKLPAWEKRCTRTALHGKRPQIVACNNIYGAWEKPCMGTALHGNSPDVAWEGP